MNPQIWWYLARASGIVAWLFLTTAVLWGIALSTDLFAKRRRPAWLLDLHRALGALAIVMVAIHLAALVADSFVHFTVVDLIVPFASDWKPWQVALGVIAMWGLVVVEATSLAMKHLPKRLWRAVHFTSYLTFLLTSLHGTFAGTDATNLMYVATSVITTIALLMAVVYRILTRRAVTRPKEKTVRTERFPTPGSRWRSGTMPADAVVGQLAPGDELPVVLARLAAAGIPEDRIRVLASDNDLTKHHRRHGWRGLWARYYRSELGYSGDGIQIGIFEVTPSEANDIRNIVRNSGLEAPHYFSSWTYV